MAIYGVGSNWDEGDVKDVFFEENKFVLGWNNKSASDLYSLVSSLKVGDILYIKSNKPGSRDIKVKGIGIITKSFMGCIMSGEYNNDKISDWQNLFVNVNWLYKKEFIITVPKEEGKLTNIRAATAYEEFLPYVQKEILEKIIGA